jgi:hypothetical protein
MGYNGTGWFMNYTSAPSCTNGGYNYSGYKINDTGVFLEYSTVICNGINGSVGPVGPIGPVGPAGPAGANGTSGVSSRCAYERYGYYNLNLPWYGERGCV